MGGIGARTTNFGRQVLCFGTRLLKGPRGCLGGGRGSASWDAAPGVWPRVAAAVRTRLATGAPQVRRDHQKWDPAKSDGAFLLSSGRDQNRYYGVAHGSGRVPNEIGFSCRTLHGGGKHFAVQERGEIPPPQRNSRAVGPRVLLSARPPFWGGRRGAISESLRWVGF